MMEKIEKLRAIAALCQSGSPLPPTLAGWLGTSLTAFLEHQFSSVDEALGLRFPRGGVPWWLEEGMRCRDAALREIARRYAGDKPVAAQAAFVSTLSRRFHTTSWRLDMVQAEMPMRYVGTPKELLWAAFKSGARMPLGERRLRSILTGCGLPRTPSNDNTPRSDCAAIADSPVEHAENPCPRPRAGTRAALANKVE
jgi:hypothetical protein